MEDEVIGQLREISSSPVVACDLCGQPRSAVSVVLIEGRRGSAEPLERLRLCEQCRRLMEADELPLEPEADLDAPLVE